MAGEITAAGAVVWRPDARDPSSPEIALVHRPRYDDWSLPKGKLERGERARSAAVREVGEETGYRVALGRHLGRTRYRVTRPEPAAKVVEYYAARALDGAFAPGEETDDLRWLTPSAALELLSYEHDKRIVTGFASLPHDTAPLLLVRHAKAGSRSEWTGPDDERPLSANGRRQVPPIEELCALFRPTRVHSAPLVRCVDTVAGVAASAGVPVVPEPLLSEAGYAGREEAAVARVLELVGAGSTPVVCSQGGVIPDLVSRVAGASGLPVHVAKAKKASVWALFFAPAADPQLVAANYIPKP
jgi:8-oxo-(d)GTP phosphatase